MNPLGLLFYLEGLGVQLKPEGEGIHFRAPDGVLTDSLKELVKVNKPELVKMLQARRKFGYKEAALFSLLEKRVATPQGSGELLSVFRKYCRVQLHRTGTVVLHRPTVIIALAVTEFTEAVAA